MKQGTRHAWLGPAAALLVIGSVACRSVPTQPGDGSSSGAELDAGDGVRLLLSPARPFGWQGEMPTGLMASAPGEEMLVLTDRAVYRLDREARVSHRWAWPAAAQGIPARVLEARWDGIGLGALVRWAGDATSPAGIYLALTDDSGTFVPAAMVSLAPVTSQAQLDRDSDAHLVIWSALAQPAGLISLELTRVTRAGDRSSRTLLSELPAQTTVGDWLVANGGATPAALCTIEPGGRVIVRRFDGDELRATIDLSEPGHRAVGSCDLASSGGSLLVIWKRAALPPDQVDAGTRTEEMGPASLSYDTVMVQLIDGGDRALPRAIPLSGLDGTLQLESVLWDGLRYLVLLNRVGYRGGRLVLSAIDDDGQLLWRDQEIPLDYEPGQLQAARLSRAGSDYALVYSTRRPWDEGVLYLVRLAVVAAPR